MQWKEFSNAPRDGKRFLAKDNYGQMAVLYFSPGSELFISDMDPDVYYDEKGYHLEGEVKMASFLDFEIPK